jgi:hypothetical protein
MASFATTTHSLLDTRLMIAWARALDETGERDKARYVAERLKEFRNADAKEFFAACAAAPAASAPLPFQCQPPQQRHSWREFVVAEPSVNPGHLVIPAKAGDHGN